LSIPLWEKGEAKKRKKDPKPLNQCTLDTDNNGRKEIEDNELKQRKDGGREIILPRNT